MDSNSRYRTLFFALSLVPLFQATEVFAASVKGFINAGYEIPDVEATHEGTFAVKSMSLLIAHEDGIYGFFGELAFNGAPGFQDNGDGHGANSPGADSYGAFNVDRAWGEVRYSDLFNLRVGKDLTPTLTNALRYPNLIIPATTPFMVGHIFDEFFTGTAIYGKIPGGIQYYSWAQNGSPIVKTDDSTGHTTQVPYSTMTFGLKLSTELQVGSGTVKLGVIGAKHNDADEKSTKLGAEIDLSIANISMQTEYAKNEHRRGFYDILSYTFDVGAEGELIPYVMYDTFFNQLADGEASTIPEDSLSEVRRTAVGLTYRPQVAVAEKIEIMHEPKNELGNKKTSITFSYALFFN